MPGLPTLSILLHGNKDHQNSQWHHGSGRKTWGTTGLSARLKARFRNCQFLPSEPSSFQIWTINLLVLTFKIQLFVCLFVYTGEGFVGIPAATGGHRTTFRSQSSLLLRGSRDRIQVIVLAWQQAPFPTEPSCQPLYTRPCL